MEHSEAFKELPKALAVFNQQLVQPKKTKTADAGKYKYSYASLDDVVIAIQRGMKDTGLSFIQDVTNVANGVQVKTMIMHSSGEYLCSSPFVLGSRGDAQSYGSAITYAKRYSLSTLLGIAAEDDDDGARAEAPNNNQRNSSRTSSDQNKQSKPNTPQVSPQQAERIEKAIKSIKELVSKDSELQSMLAGYEKSAGASIASWDFENLAKAYTTLKDYKSKKVEQSSLQKNADQLLSSLAELVGKDKSALGTEILGAEGIDSSELKNLDNMKKYINAIGSRLKDAKEVKPAVNQAEQLADSQTSPVSDIAAQAAAQAKAFHEEAS